MITLCGQWFYVLIPDTCDFLPLLEELREGRDAVEVKLRERPKSGEQPQE